MAKPSKSYRIKGFDPTSDDGLPRKVLPLPKNFPSIKGHQLPLKPGQKLKRLPKNWASRGEQY